MKIDNTDWCIYAYNNTVSIYLEILIFVMWKQSVFGWLAISRQTFVIKKYCFPYECVADDDVSRV